MPKLDTELHVKMFEKGKRDRALRHRLKAAFDILMGRTHVYGLEWGDPESCPPLAHVRDHFLRPYVSSGTTIVEIGPGGGRWTRYMLGARKIYAVDYHQELLDQLRTNLGRRANAISFIKNNGDDFPGIPDQTIDLVFSFGTFVHFDIDIIDRYLKNVRRLLGPHSNVIIHYSDKTKPIARDSVWFSENDPDRMRALVLSHGYAIHEEDVTTMWHSGIIRFGLPAPTGAPPPST